MFKIGFGYDVHRLVKDRPLILGGVEIPHEVGLDGHSDADVLTHAVIDALLGAMAIGDIGQHFPDSDPSYSGADSLEMLNQVVLMMSRKGLRLNNLDTTVVAQAPKLAPFFPEMKDKIADVFGVETDLISIKATTTERLGFCGKEEGIEAFAVISLAPIS